MWNFLLSLVGTDSKPELTVHSTNDSTCLFVLIIGILSLIILIGFFCFIEKIRNLKSEIEHLKSEKTQNQSRKL